MDAVCRMKTRLNQKYEEKKMGNGRASKSELCPFSVSLMNAVRAAVENNDKKFQPLWDALNRNDKTFNWLPAVYWFCDHPEWDGVTYTDR